MGCCTSLGFGATFQRSGLLRKAKLAHMQNSLTRSIDDDESWLTARRILATLFRSAQTKFMLAPGLSKMPRAERCWDGSKEDAKEHRGKAQPASPRCSVLDLSLRTGKLYIPAVLIYKGAVHRATP